jgi:hypothetical protein
MNKIPDDIDFQAWYDSMEAQVRVRSAADLHGPTHRPGQEPGYNQAHHDALVQDAEASSSSGLPKSRFTPEQTAVRQVHAYRHDCLEPDRSRSARCDCKL